MATQPNDTKLDFNLNGTTVTIYPKPDERLSAVLRERLDAKDVKIGCNAGDCGACTVLVNGDAVCACLMPARQATGCHIETVAGLVKSDPVAKDLSERFQDHGAAQCGFCTPGMMVSAVELLRRQSKPTEQQVLDALGGVLCRCTGYRKIIDAVMGKPASLSLNNEPGAAIRRVDGDDKVAGCEQFGDDIAPAETLELLIIRSPYSHANFTFGDLVSWQKSQPGIIAVLTASDVPGTNQYCVLPNFADQPVFAENFVRFRGEAVAAVVGTSETISTFKQEEFPVTWEELPAIFEISEATSDSAALIHSDRNGNVLCQGKVTCGDVDSALKSADVVVEGEFTTSFVEHAYLEPEAGFARVVDGCVEIRACTQSPWMDMEALEKIMNLERGKVRIIPTGIGGGFGSKLDLSVEPFLALAAIKTGQPVRLNYSRVESMQSTTKRHPCHAKIQIGANKNGQISGLNFSGDFNTGAYASWGPTVAIRVPVHASGPYHITNYHAIARGIHTNCPPSGAFRGFGVPQSAIAQESMFDELATKLQMDPLEFRIKNALVDGNATVCGQVFKSGVGIKPCLEALQPEWKTESNNIEEFNRNSPKYLKRGIGVGTGWYGCGNTAMPNPSKIKAGIKSDGTIILHQGAVDIGQGSDTVISQLFANEFGVSISEIELVHADTFLTPDAGKTSASRQTFVSGNAAIACARELKSKITRRFNVAYDANLCFNQQQLTVSENGQDHIFDVSEFEPDSEGYVFVATGTYDPPTTALNDEGQGAPYSLYGYAAQMVVVEVDKLLGTVKLIRIVAAHDVGKAINPILAEGQVQGGITQGIGMALMEEYLPGKTENLHDYLIPTIGDVPPIDTILVEVPDPHGPLGAKGLGEHALIPTAPAILNAIKRATGVRMCQVPVTPARLLAAIKELE